MKIRAVKNKSTRAIIPKNKLYKMHFFIAIFRPEPPFPSSSSATILVAARLIPEFAKVVAKV